MRNRALAAAALVTTLLSACGGTQGAITDPTTTGPTITMLVTDFEASWEPAWSPSSGLAAEIAAALRSNGLWLPIPAESLGSGTTLLADLRISTRVPVGSPTADLVVRHTDGSVFVSIQTTPNADGPICLRHDAPGSDWASAVVRNVTGCALDVPGAVSYVEWTESGQNFHAEYPSGVDAATLIGWLATWSPVGAS